MMEAQSRDVDVPVEKYQLPRSQAMVLHAFRHPLTVGAVAAASPQLVSQVIAEIDSLADLVVELGTGTGIITRALLEQRQYRAGVVSIEIDPQLAELARVGCADGAEVMVGDALQLESLIEAGRADSIVCSLPLTLFSATQLDQLFSGALASLKPGGAFVFYLYRPGLWGRRYRRVVTHARKHFASVDEGQTVWRNLPPARVIVCR
jgi:phosphatidylethanolamine/phosphatidyl-N-methylethanolamine N-methyltransferase